MYDEAAELMNQQLKQAEEEKQKMIEILKAAGISEEDIQAKLKND